MQTDLSGWRAGKTPINCDYFPTITECYCSKNIPDPAMPNGRCAVCIPCPPHLGRPLAATAPLQQQPQPQAQPTDSIPRQEHDQTVKTLQDELQRAKEAVAHFSALARVAITRNHKTTRGSSKSLNSDTDSMESEFLQCTA